MYTALEHVLRHVRDDEFKRQTIELDKLQAQNACLAAKVEELLNERMAVYRAIDSWWGSIPERIQRVSDSNPQSSVN